MLQTILRVGRHLHHFCTCPQTEPRFEHCHGPNRILSVISRPRIWHTQAPVHLQRSAGLAAERACGEPYRSAAHFLHCLTLQPSSFVNAPLADNIASPSAAFIDPLEVSLAANHTGVVTVTRYFSE